MKLIAADAAQSLQFFVPDDVRPLSGQVHYRTFVNEILERYQFERIPTIEDILDNNTSKFQNGTLPDRRDIVIRNLDIYVDGVLTISNETTSTRLILLDFYHFLTERFGYRLPPNLQPLVHTSNLVVEFDISINSWIKKYDELATLVSDTYEEASNMRLPFDLLQLALQVDPELARPNTSTQFSIERRAKTPYQLNRYYCSAPLSTEGHLAFLEKVEKLLAG